jgi:membrane-bound metal-dependent hydrolase YbcI (DUF457 family)
VNKRGHLINAALLSVGLAVLLEGATGAPTLRTLLVVGVPVTLGALFPDVDTAFGTHRKTFHNLPTLGVFVAFPVVFGNLQYVWIGVLTHYVLDLCGNVRGMALFYPWPEEYDVPVGVNVDSPWADVVTLAVTGVELAVVWAALETGAHAAVLDALGGLV